MKYAIVPNAQVIGIAECNTPEDAIINFATLMDTNMNKYFSAKEITDDEYCHLRDNEGIEDYS